MYQYHVKVRCGRSSSGANRLPSSRDVGLFTPPTESRRLPIIACTHVSSLSLLVFYIYKFMLPPACLPALSQIVPTLFEPISGALVDSNQFSATDFVQEIMVRGPPFVYLPFSLNTDHPSRLPRHVRRFFHNPFPIALNQSPYAISPVLACSPRRVAPPS